MDQSQIKEIIGKDQYWTCMAFFQELLERQSDFKIIMTEGCFSLFKIFSPILEKRRIKNRCGQIITDKSIDLYLDDINVSLEKSSDSNRADILLVDDIIIYGRNINKTIDKILGNFNDSDNIEKIKEGILVRAMMESLPTSRIKKEYKNNVQVSGFGSKENWKQLSSRFSTLRKASDIEFEDIQRNSPTNKIHMKTLKSKTMN